MDDCRLPDSDTLAVLNDEPANSTLIRSWRTTVTTNSDATIIQHPDLFANTQGTINSIHLYRTTCNGPQTGLAVFTEANVATVGRSTRIGELSGLRLVGPVLTPTSMTNFMEALARHVARTDTEAILFEDVRVGSELWNTLWHERQGRRFGIFYPQRPQPRWWIEFPEDRAEYWKRFSRKSRGNLRRAAEKLPHELRCYRHPSDIPLFLNDAHSVSMRSWQSRRIGTRVRNSPYEQQRLSSLAEHGALRCYVLYHQNTPVAFVRGYQWHDRYHYEEVGFDSNFADRSPGTVLLVKIIEDLMANDPQKWMDFGFGDGDYKRRFSNRHGMAGSVLAVRPTWRPMVLANLGQSGRVITRFGRFILRQSGLYDTVRKQYRSGAR